MLAAEAPTACSKPPQSAHRASLTFKWAMVVFFALAVTSHWLISTRITTTGTPDAWESPSTIIFAIVGLVFLALTFLSDIPVTMALRAQSREPMPTSESPKADLSPMASLLIPMAVRCTGTFLVLGFLVVSKILSREESVFDVLFWYVTLTAMEIAHIVWASQALMRQKTLENVSQATGP